MFLREGQEEDATAAIKEGNFIKIKGITTIDKFDGELTIGSIVGIKKSEDFTSKRVDNAPVKRVELHCHTKMSDMDGVSEVKDLVKRAKVEPHHEGVRGGRLDLRQEQDVRRRRGQFGSIRTEMISRRERTA